MEHNLCIYWGSIAEKMSDKSSGGSHWQTAIAVCSYFLLIFTFVVPWVKEGTIGHNLAVSLNIPSKASRLPAVVCFDFLLLL